MPNLGIMSSSTRVASAPPVSGYARWYDASVAGSITSASNLVSQWNDLSGNAGHLTQATSTYQPTTNTTTQNGKNVIVGSTSKMTATISVTSNALTVFVVGNKTAAGNGNQLYSRLSSIFPLAQNDYDSTNAIASFLANASFGGENPANAVYRNSATVTAQAYSFNTPVTQAYKLDGGNVRLTTNGTVTTGSTSTNAMNSNRLTLFCQGDHALPSGDSFLNGWLGEVIIYYSALSDTDMDSVSTYLRTKWGTA